MLVGLYRSNPDAFIRNNMNLVKSGKILRVPDAQELSAITQGEAAKEVRTQVADWRAYSGRVADKVGTAPEGGSTARSALMTAGDPASAGKNLSAWAPAARAAKASLGVKKPGIETMPAATVALVSLSISTTMPRLAKKSASFSKGPAISGLLYLPISAMVLKDFSISAFNHIAGLCRIEDSSSGFRIEELEFSKNRVVVLPRNRLVPNPLS
mgnify:CR=1 FL=1